MKSFFKDKSRKDGLNHTCSPCVISLRNDWRQRNKERANTLQTARRKRCVDSWRDYFKNDTHCECCGKDIQFATGKGQNSICFDHRRGDEVIQGNPANWLQSNSRTPENQKLWESCDFGKLCVRCNSMLPSKDRKAFVEKVLRYTDV